VTFDKTYPCHTGNYTKSAARKIEYIVVHYTGSVASALNSVKYYSSLKAEASAHYFVGHKSEGAKIYQSVEDNNIAWHCGTNKGYYHPKCRNANSIGIETCCHNDTADKTAMSRSWYFDKETVDALVELVKYLMEKYSIDADRIVRHYDVTHKLCPSMWVHDESAWKAFKARLVDDDIAEYKETIQNHVGYSDPSAVWKLLDVHPYAKDLYRKWAESYK
jgi:N-acetylmuramoyl-L-alanine amidase CwlA